MMNYRLLTIIVLSFFIIQGCSVSNESAKGSHSDDLIVIEGAKDVKYANLHGTEQVFYRVDMAYPAAKALVEISERLKARGWEPLTESFLNPGHPSSHVTGWGYFVDGTKPSSPLVHQWGAEWKNKNGDILWYGLRYELPDKKSLILENNNLQIYAGFTPASVAEADKEAFSKKEPSSSKGSKP